MAEIFFTVSRVGNVKIEPRGYGGGLCREVTKAYEAAIGGTGKSVPTDEAALEPIKAVTQQVAKVNAG